MPETNRKRLQSATAPSVGISAITATMVAALGLWLAMQTESPLLDSILLLDHIIPFQSSKGHPEVVDRANRITYRGTLQGSTEHYQNIFYGEDTSGRNRLAPPKPYLTAPGSIVDATTPGAWCSQGLGPTFPFASAVTNVSENCLSLWIARPRGTDKSAKLPVAVYMHGGGHGFGSTYEILYTPDGLIEQSARQGEPIIYVGINYRVGFFGFAYTDALQARNHTNVGIRDQLAAFEWVQKHIANFGGDPHRVTAIGNSAGSADIGLHLTSFGGNKGVPYHRGLMIGAAPNSMFNLKRDDTKERTALVAEQVGCSETAYPSPAAVIECLRETPWEKLTNVSVDMMRKARPPFGEQFFAPRYDGDLISDLPSEAMRKGHFNKGIPLIASWNRNDGAWLPSATITTDDEVTDSIAVFITGLSQESRAKILEIYPVSDFEHMIPPESGLSAQYFRAAQISRDFWFTCPSIDFTWQYARHSDPEHVRLWETNQTRFTPVFTYMGVPFWGVSHLSDIPYVFNIRDLPGGIDSSPAQLSLAREMSSQIISFINQRNTADAGTFPSDWTPAYTDHDKNSLKSEHPRSINVKVFGGPQGSGMASASRTGSSQSTRDQWVAEEKLFTRCDFINSAKLRSEMSV